METLITPSNITFVLGILGAIFSIFFYFRKPQEDMELKQAVAGKEIETKATVLAQKEMENKATVLANQFTWEREANEKKFADFGARLDASFLLASNHTNTVDVKVDKLIASVNFMGNEITRLSTIIEERIPRVSIK